MFVNDVFLLLLQAVDCLMKLQQILCQLFYLNTCVKIIGHKTSIIVS